MYKIIDKKRGLFLNVSFLNKTKMKKVTVYKEILLVNFKLKINSSGSSF